MYSPRMLQDAATLRYSVLLAGLKGQWILAICLLQALQVSMAESVLPLRLTHSCCKVILCPYHTPLPAILREEQLLLWFASKRCREDDLLVQSPIELGSYGTHL